MGFKSIALVAATLTISTSVNAAIINHGTLTTDDTTNYITDTSTDRIYTRFDAFNLMYDDLLTAISSGGEFDGWSIVTVDIANDFYNAALGVPSSPCDLRTDPIGVECGTISGWSDGDFGASDTDSEDWFAFLNTSVPLLINTGLVQITDAGIVFEYEYVTTTAIIDIYPTINYLLYKDPVSSVPVPAAVWLFASGLLGLIGVARGKVRV